MPRCIVHTDGHVAPDGRGGWAFVARETGKRADAERARQAGALAGAASHLAEWIAMSRALAWAEATLGEGDVLELRTDSALVEKGLASRRPAMSGEAGALRAGCRQALARLAQRGVRAQVIRVAREENAAADALAREAAVADAHR